MPQPKGGPCPRGRLLRLLQLLRQLFFIRFSLCESLCPLWQKNPRNPWFLSLIRVFRVWSLPRTRSGVVRSPQVSGLTPSSPFLQKSAKIRVIRGSFLFISVNSCELVVRNNSLKTKRLQIITGVSVLILPVLGGIFFVFFHFFLASKRRIS